MAGEVFISYAKEDEVTALAVCATLERQGVTCWIAVRDVSHGEDWAEEIVRAIGGCRVLLVVLSASANRSHQVAKEVSVADKKKKNIIVFNVDDTSPAGGLELHLTRSHWVAAADPPGEKDLEALCLSVKGKLWRSSAVGAGPAVKDAGRASFGWFRAVVVTTLAALVVAGLWFLPVRRPTDPVIKRETPPPTATPTPPGVIEIGDINVTFSTGGNSKNEGYTVFVEVIDRHTRNVVSESTDGFGKDEHWENEPTSVRVNLKHPVKPSDCGQYKLRVRMSGKGDNSWEAGVRTYAQVNGERIYLLGDEKSSPTLSLSSRKRSEDFNLTCGTPKPPSN